MRCKINPCIAPSPLFQHIHSFDTGQSALIWKVCVLRFLAVCKYWYDTKYSSFALFMQHLFKGCMLHPEQSNDTNYGKAIPFTGMALSTYDCCIGFIDGIPCITSDESIYCQSEFPLKGTYRPI